MNVSEVKELFENDLHGRILKSDLPFCDIDNLSKQVNRWRQAGDVIVFTAGVFDIFTINHLLGLYHYKILGGKRARLIVSIDSDERVRSSKAFREDKGNIVKPILSWESRSLMVAKQSFNNEGTLVDVVTRHGADTCSGIRCPHDDNVDIAKYISPDIIVVTSTSLDTIQRIEEDPDIQDKIVIINEEDLSYEDLCIGGKISTSGIIKRIKNGI
jgi:bifunctional ADP-heptose synthase (sugar kinase/adenylyltransferase)